MKSRIQVSPNIHFGKPCVAGTRITVQNVLELVREGIPFDALIRDYYPDLKVEDIKACIRASNTPLTWNCNHLANAQILDRLEPIAAAGGFKLPRVCTPEELMGVSSYE